MSVKKIIGIIIVSIFDLSGSGRWLPYGDQFVGFNGWPKTLFWGMVIMVLLGIARAKIDKKYSNKALKIGEIKKPVTEVTGGFIMVVAGIFALVMEKFIIDELSVIYLARFDNVYSSASSAGWAAFIVMVATVILCWVVFITAAFIANKRTS